MRSFGCIQALECNNNTYLIGVATQGKQLIKGLDVENKAIRNKSFHEQTVNSYTELLSVAGFTCTGELSRKNIK